MPKRRRAAQRRAPATPRRPASPSALPDGTAPPRRRGRALRRLAPLCVSILLIGVVVFLAWCGNKTPREEHLIRDLRGPNAANRAVAAYQLSQEKHPSVSAVEALARLLGDDEDEPRGEAVAALISLGTVDAQSRAVAVRSMASLLSDGASRSVQRVEAAHVLGQLGAQNKQVASLLAVALRSADDSLRAAAAAALGLLGVDDGLVLRSLMAATGDNEPDVRAAALEALTRLRPDSLTVHIAARLVREDTSTVVRVTAVYAVAVSNRLDAQIVSTLEVALNDSQPQVRRAAAIALSRFGSAARSALNALRSVGKDSVASVRHAAEEAIRAITGRHP